MQQTLADKTHWFTFIAASPKALGCIVTVVECWKDSVTILLFDAADATELLLWHHWQLEDINLTAAAGVFLKVSAAEKMHFSHEITEC